MNEIQNFRRTTKAAAAAPTTTSKTATIIVPSRIFSIVSNYVLSSTWTALTELDIVASIICDSTGRCIIDNCADIGAVYKTDQATGK